MADKTHYTIQIGDEILEFEGPSGLSDRQIERLGDSYLRTAKPGVKIPHSVYAGTYEGDTASSPEDSSAIGAFMRGAPHGAYMNWDDEIAGLINAGIPGSAELDNAVGMSGGAQKGPFAEGSFWDKVKSNAADFNRQKQIDEEQHRGASTLGELTGTLATLPVAEASVARLPQGFRAAAAARPILTSLGIGAGAGTVSGAGAGNGNRAQSAALGGITGAALGGGVGVASELAPVIANYGKVFFNKGVNSEAIRQLTKALHRDGFDVTSPAGVLKLKTALQEFTGKPVSLADIGGATRARAGVGLRAPSDAQQQTIDLIQARQAGQGQRLAKDIRSTVAPRTDVHALDESLVEQRAQEAAKLREQALYEDAPLPANDVGTGVAPPPIPKGLNIRNPTPEEKLRLGAAGRDTAVGTPNGNGRVVAFMEDKTVNPPTLRARVEHEDGSRQTYAISDLAEPKAVAGRRQARIINDPELQQLVRLPDAQKALTAALERSESERALLATQGKDISHLPDLSRGSDLDVRTVDTLKRFLDDEVSSLYKRGDTATFKAGQAGQVKNLRNAIRDRLREVVPEYGRYLDAYKGSSEMIDSLAAGREFNNLDPEQIAAEQGKRSTAGQELYRVGAARNLLDTIKSSTDTANPASRILNSPEAREQLLATGVGPADAARLNKAVHQERILNLLPRELSGSDTSQRMAAQADAASGGHIDVPLMAAQPISWLAMGGRRLLNKTMLDRMSGVNEALLPKLTATDPKAIGAVIAELEQQGNIAAARTLRRQLKERATALGGSNIIGSPVALPNTGDQ